ncbi:MAG TPA: TonB family protein [Fibrobacteria bacterium]|nr:TonB family protein [Fibrobacteria bacterium]HOX52105.1 TonB family protein [Fibrobacteria bacterium]
MTRSKADTRFRAFLALSALVHGIAFVSLILFSLLQSQRKTKPVAFELVGIPAKGDGGSPARNPHPTKPPDAETSTPPPPAQPETSKPSLATPPKPPSETGVAPKTPANTASAPTPAPQTSKPTEKGSAEKTAAASTTDAKPGKQGVPGGDTLAVGSAKGLPSPMAFWLSRVKFLVEQNWRAPGGLSGVTQMPEVVFQVARDGKPSLAQLKVKSGNASLDRIALRAVQAVSMFPPVPDVWPEDKVVVRYVLQYSSQ